TNTTLISIYFIAVLIHEDPPTPLQQFFSLMPQPPSHLSTLSLHDALPISITVTDEHHSHDNGGYCEIRAADGGTIHIPSLTASRSEEHTSELESRFDLVCRLLLEKKKKFPSVVP